MSAMLPPQLVLVLPGLEDVFGDPVRTRENGLREEGLPRHNVEAGDSTALVPPAADFGGPPEGLAAPELAGFLVGGRPDAAGLEAGAAAAAAAAAPLDTAAVITALSANSLT